MVATSRILDQALIGQRFGKEFVCRVSIAWLRELKRQQMPGAVRSRNVMETICTYAFKSNEDVLYSENKCNNCVLLFTGC